MRIEEVRLHFICLPFRVDFSHASNRGSFSQNIVVEVVADSGRIRGFGEGAPREYVTGESQKTAASSMQELLSGGRIPWDVHDVSEIWKFIDGLPEGKEHNAALCALEMAMLDALANAQKRSVREYFSSPFSTERIFYGAVLPLGSRERIMELSGLVRRLGISRLKIKLARDIAENREILDGVHRVFNGSCELKADANGSWNLQTALEHLALLERHGVSVLEQPMIPGDPDLALLCREATRHGMKLMADESACSIGEVKALLNEGFYDLINVRLSKCGGFRRSLRIVNLLRRSKMPFQIACQLGESGLLSAAGRILSMLCGDALYHDGSYDRFLLRENVTKEDVIFGVGGEAGPLEGVGLGVTVEMERLHRLRGGADPICFSKT